MSNNEYIKVQNAAYEEKLNLGIEVLGLPNKQYNALKKRGKGSINTIGELLKLSRNELNSIRYLGPTGIEIIILSLKKLGLRFNFEMEEQIPSTKEDYLYLRDECLKAIRQKEKYMYELQKEICQLEYKVSEFEDIIKGMSNNNSEGNNEGLHV